jgi:hypothetical protein
MKAPRALIQSYHIDAGRIHLGYGQKQGRLRDDPVATTIIVAMGVEARVQIRGSVGGGVAGMQVVHAMMKPVRR